MSNKAFAKYAAHRGNCAYDEMVGEYTPRTVFHHDRAEITYSPYFRRMAFRQYHIADPGPDNRTRLLHTIEVATIASGIAKRLGANVELAEAIAYGHDIAQPPCGYPAEAVIRDFLSDAGGFEHGELAAQILEWGSKKESGDVRYKKIWKNPCFAPINFGGRSYRTTISQEAIEGIRHHTPPNGKLYTDLAKTIEGQIVRIADNLSYVSQEIEEGIKLDEKLRDMFQGYSGLTVLEFDDNGKHKQMTHVDMEKKVLGCGRDKRLLQNMFDLRLGPRLMTMIRRVEGYNKHLVKAAGQKHQSTKMNKEGEMPILEYDLVLRFVLDFIWTEFIGKHVNQHPRVRTRVARNQQSIRTALKRRMHTPPTDEREKAEFAIRKQEVEYNYPDLSWYKKKKRAVAHHISLMTTPQIATLIR